MVKISFPVTREKLYKQVWSEPMLSLATKYGVSSSYLARICTRLNVPRPERGYWAKLEHGKSVSQIPLPPATAEHEHEWTRGGFPAKRTRTLPVAPTKAMRRPLAKSRPSGRHHLIRDARSLFLRSRDPTGMFVDKDKDNYYLRPYKKLLVDILVSRDSLDVGLDVMNQLLLAIESYGYRVKIAPVHEYFHRGDIDVRENIKGLPGYDRQWSPSRITVVFIGSVAIGLTLFEYSEEIEVMRIKGESIPLDELTETQKRSAQRAYSWNTTIDRPSGRFCLQAQSPYHGTTWSNRWDIKLDKDLTRQGRKIARELADQAPDIANQVAELERQREIQREEWEIEKKQRKLQKEQERQENAHRSSIGELNLVIEAWAKQKSIESFFDEIEAAVSSIDPSRCEALSERLLLAKKLIGKTDALQSLIDWETPSEKLQRS